MQTKLLVSSFIQRLEEKSAAPTTVASVMPRSLQRLSATRFQGVCWNLKASHAAAKRFGRLRCSWSANFPFPSGCQSLAVVPPSIVSVPPKRGPAWQNSVNKVVNVYHRMFRRRIDPYGVNLR